MPGHKGGCKDASSSATANVRSAINKHNGGKAKGVRWVEDLDEGGLNVRSDLLSSPSSPSDTQLLQAVDEYNEADCKKPRADNLGAGFDPIRGQHGLPQTGVHMAPSVAPNGAPSANTVLDLMSPISPPSPTSTLGAAGAGPLSQSVFSVCDAPMEDEGGDDFVGV